MYSYFFGGFDFFDFCLLQDVRSGFDLFLTVLISQNRLLGGGDCVAAPGGSSWSL